MTERIRIDLPLVLPGVSVGDARLRLLEDQLKQEVGVDQAHVIQEDGGGQALLCLHYDPSRLTLPEIRRTVMAVGARTGNRYAQLIVPLRLVGSEDAYRRIERRVAAVPGILRASVSLASQQATIEYDRQVTSPEAIQRSVTTWLAPDERDASGQPARPGSWYARHRELVWSLTAGALLLAAFVAERGGWLGTAWPIVIYLGAYLFGGLDLVRHAVGDLRRGRFAFDIDLLMLLAAAGAAVLGEWAEGAFLLFLFSLAHSLEHAALGRARRAIRALADLAPARAMVIRDGSQEEVAVADLVPGDVVLVRSGERVPVDGVVGDGRSSINQAPITGESVPVAKEPGDEVFAGTINGTGVLHVRTVAAEGDRTLDRVIRLVEEAQGQKAPTQLFTERFERVFVPVVLATDVALIALPPLFGWWTLDVSFYRGMALLVAASPCALALGTPATVLAGIAQAARSGVLIKGGAHLEMLGQVRAIAFDKTGTITRGTPEVTDLVPTEGVEEAELLAVAASVELHSEHPLAEAVVTAADQRQLALPESRDVESVTARGITAFQEDARVEIGTLRLWQDQGVRIPGPLEGTVDALQAEGRSTMVVRRGDRWLGVIGAADRPREGIAEVLRRLHAQGVTGLVMLTGDNAGVAQAIAREVGLDDVRAGLLPEDKVTAIQELQAKHRLVAMVGDGVNDAPALAHATVGIAMGGAGTAAALETADVALMADDLERLPFAIGLSQRASTTIRQNLVLSLVVIGVLILVTTTGVAGIGSAVLVHEGSTLLVVANSLRLLRYTGPID